MKIYVHKITKQQYHEDEVDFFGNDVFVIRKHYIKPDPELEYNNNDYYTTVDYWFTSRQKFYEKFIIEELTLF